jgi:ABC-type polysaccharide/polyol phosphate transport system ATPase subunit
MSYNSIIEVSSIGKVYTIYKKPSDRLKQALWRGYRQFYREFHAVKNVSFNVLKGETVGIIGRNGSGKSTLLQLICGTVSATSGSVTTSGRIAALLELGSGFNPEFSGLENTHMNAALLGMSKSDIEGRLAAILAFADIGDFIDQPVKTYSSGMFVRLAFAIAVHADPEVLIIDEALSVGDIAFQNRCIQKIQDLKRRGTSILFVSHDLSTIQIICDRVIWMKDGCLRAIGDPISVCQEYFADTMPIEAIQFSNIENAIPQQITNMAQLTKLRLSDESNNITEVYSLGKTLNLNFELLALQNLDETVFTVSIYRGDGDWSVGQTSIDTGVIWPALMAGMKHKGRLILAPLSLTPANYKICLSAFSSDLKTCYAMTELTTAFTVRSHYQTWGKFVHPSKWEVL